MANVFSPDIPWMESMSSSTRESVTNPTSSPAGSSETPTYAAFSPAALGRPTLGGPQRSTILVHQKSPLLVATPPQITRTLAYAYPFIVPLNRLVGLLSWTSGDAWESFLLVAAFCAVTLYGDNVMRWAGPVVLVGLLILGMYTRRYSPLSSKGVSEDKAKNDTSARQEARTRHHMSLDEIVDELKLFTSRCDILLDPALRLTDFLSTQRSATTATTRPALTALFIRILFITPIWIILTLPPLYIITTRRVILVIGTISLSWHSRPARVTRTILWRSRTVHRICAVITGLNIGDPSERRKGQQSGLWGGRRKKNANDVAAALAAKRRPESPGIRFTFTVYENQRRWLGIGWTASMLAYERASWTDEELNPSASIDHFDLPEVEGGHARWRWAQGSKWHVEAIGDDFDDKDASDQDKGWIYYDNQWHGGRRDQDGWGRYTRRRKWCRDAELVEVTASTEVTPSPTPRNGESDDNDTRSVAGSEAGASSATTAVADSATHLHDDAESVASAGGTKKRRWFRRSSGGTNTIASGSSRGSGYRDDDEDDDHTPLQRPEKDYEWRGADEVRMGLE